MRWSGCSRARVEDRCCARLTHVFECGPGKVLAGMTKRIDAQAVSASVHDPASLREAAGLLSQP
jgi:[acyl-carrier-protein] S-malonyltransferase